MLFQNTANIDTGLGQGYWQYKETGMFWKMADA